MISPSREHIIENENQFLELTKVQNQYSKNGLLVTNSAGGPLCLLEILFCTEVTVYMTEKPLKNVFRLVFLKHYDSDN